MVERASSLRFTMKPFRCWSGLGEFVGKEFKAASHLSFLSTALCPAPSELFQRSWDTVWLIMGEWPSLMGTPAPADAVVARTAESKRWGFGFSHLSLPKSRLTTKSGLNTGASTRRGGRTADARLTSRTSTRIVILQRSTFV